MTTVLAYAPLPRCHMTYEHRPEDFLILPSCVILLILEECLRVALPTERY